MFNNKRLLKIEAHIALMYQQLNALLLRLEGHDSTISELKDKLDASDIRSSENVIGR
jgi:hypothetical protein